MEGLERGISPSGIWTVLGLRDGHRLEESGVELSGGDGWVGVGCHGVMIFTLASIHVPLGIGSGE